MDEQTTHAWSIDTLLWDPATDILGLERTFILRALRSLEPATVRTISNHSDLTAHTIKAHLGALTATGLLRQNENSTYNFNEGHVLTKPLWDVLDARKAALTRIAALAAETVDEETTVALFAPTTHNTAAIVIVHSKQDGAAATELGRILRVVLPGMVGHHPQTDVIDHDELRQRIENRDPRALRHWWRSHTLRGPNLTQLMIAIEREITPHSGTRKPPLQR